MRPSILPAALAFAFAAALPAQAQNDPTGPGNTSTQKAGEAYPNDKAAGSDKGSPEPVRKAAQSRPAQKTQEVAKKAGNAVSDTAGKAAEATRRAGQSLARKLPATQNNAPQR